MQAAADEFTSGFDFDTAHRAITERRRLHRRAGVSMGVMIGMIAVLSVVSGSRSGRLITWSVALPAAPLILWWAATAIAAWRERRLIALRGDAVMDELFRASRVRVRQEFEVVRACVVLTCMGLAVLIADSLVRGLSGRALLAIVCLGVLMAVTIPRVIGARAKRRAEAFASGRLSADDFARGRDPGDPGTGTD